jgi:hypothetical protein
MNRASRALVAILFLLLPACTGVSDVGDCPEPPTLAAGEATLALSCAEMVEFHDRDYSVGCLSVHPTRVGDILVDDGGQTSYQGARAIEGIASKRAFILTGDRCGRRGRVATTDGFTEAEFDVVRLPFGVRGPAIAVPYRTLNSGQVVSLAIGAPRSFVWGAAALLERRTADGWKPALLLHNYRDRAINSSVRVGSGGVNDIDYRGHSIVRVKLRQVPVGDYRITKDFVRAGSGPIERRTITRSVRVRIAH